MERRKIKSECDFSGFRNNRSIYKCKECRKRCSKPINEAIENFSITYQICNDALNKFVLMLRKVVYPYEYMDSWEKFDETSILLKEAFYSELNSEGITDEDYAHVQKVWSGFEIKNQGEYHDL